MRPAGTYPSVGDLVRAALKGDQIAWRGLFEIAEPVARRIALRVLHNEADAEDIVGEAMLIITRKLATLRDPETFAKWAQRIALRRAINYLNRRREFPCSAEALERRGRLSDGELEAFHDLYEVLKCLSEDDRELIICAYVLGEPWEVLGESQGTSGNAARCRAARVLEEIRRALLADRTPSPPQRRKQKRRRR